MPSLCWCTQCHAGCSTSHHPRCHLCQSSLKHIIHFSWGRGTVFYRTTITATSQHNILQLCVETCMACQHSYLTIKWPMSVYTNTCYKTPLEIQFMYLGQREIYCILKTCCITYVLISKNSAVYFIILSFYVPKKYSPFSQVMCQFKYQSGHLKVTVWQLRATGNKYLHFYNIQLIVGIK